MWESVAKFSHHEWISMQQNKKGNNISLHQGTNLCLDSWIIKERQHLPVMHCSHFNDKSCVCVCVCIKQNIDLQNMCKNYKNMHWIKKKNGYTRMLSGTYDIISKCIYQKLSVYFSKMYCLPFHLIVDIPTYIFFLSFFLSFFLNS